MRLIDITEKLFFLDFRVILKQTLFKQTNKLDKQSISRIKNSILFVDTIPFNSISH